MSDHCASFESQLRGRQAQLLSAWRELVLASFPEQTAQFLRREGDPFRNPVGLRIREGTEAVLDAIAQGRPFRDLDGALDTLLRVRAVQGQRPSQALEFVFLFKRACRDVLGDALDAPAQAALDARLDGLALCAFDAYTRCREEIHEIHLREVRRRVAERLDRLTGGNPPCDGAMPDDGRCVR